MGIGFLMTRRSSGKGMLVWLGIGAGLMLLAHLDSEVGPSGAARQAMLTEVAALGMPSQGSQTHLSDMTGLGRSFVSAAYHGPMSSAEIRDYYVRVGTERGWRLQASGEHQTTEGRRSYVSDEHTFCKGEYEMVLSIAQESPSTNRSFGLFLKWGSPFPGPRVCSS